MHKALKDLQQLEQVDQVLNEIFVEAGQAPEEEQGMDESELKTIISSEMDRSHGDENSELSADRARALDYYFNRPRGDEITGRSQVQSSDVMDVVEWMMPDLIEAFTTNEDAVSFQPESGEDTVMARNETAYINHIFHSDANGYKMLHDFFKDALLQKNGIGKVYREDGFKTRYTEYEGITAVELEQVMMGDENTEVEIKDQEEDQKIISELSEGSRQQAQMLPEVQQQTQQIMQQAQQNAMMAMEEMGIDPQMMNPQQQQQLQQQFQQMVQESSQEALENITVTFYNVKLCTHEVDNHSACETIPPEEFHVNEDHTSLDVDNARFTCHERTYTESELIEMGYDPDVVTDLNSYNYSTNEEDFSRQYHTLNKEYGPTFDNTTRNILVRDCYMRVDFDGDGIAELRHVVMSGDKILENEYCDEIPFVCISPFMVPHRWVGVSIFDRMKQIQDIATGTWRQLMDNMFKMNNARTVVVENKVNMDDLLSSRAGGAVRVKDINALAPFPHTPIGQEAYQLLQQLSKTRMERSGVGPEMMAEGMVIDNDTAHGVERLMSAKEKLQGIIIRNFAETGVAKIFCKLHALELKHQNKERQVRVNGAWTNMNPWEWKHRSKTTIKVGLGAGDKMKHAQTMEGILAKQEKLISSGYSGILVNDEGVYNALTDSVRYQGIRNPELYYVDPNSEPAKQAKQAKAKAAQEPSMEDKVIMLTSQIEQKDAQLKEMKQGMQAMKDSDEQARKWAKDEDESHREWTSLEIKANKDLGPEGRAL